MRDSEVKNTGAFSARLEGEAGVDGVATLMQAVPAAPYLSRRVGLSGMVRTRGVEGWTGLWMRVDRASGRPEFDNMQNRPLRGTRGWAMAEVVLDVPDDATSIQFGLLQSGPGTSWVDGLSLDVVGADQPVTGVDPRPTEIENGSFEAQLDSTRGWFLSGWGRSEYAAEADERVVREGKKSLRFFSKVPKPKGSCALNQVIRADHYRGRRVSFSSWVRGENLGGGGVGIRTLGVDTPTTADGLTADFRLLASTFDWTQVRQVIDVPEDADTLMIKFRIQSGGTLWADDVQVEVVGDDVPPTHELPPGELGNPGFEARKDEPVDWHRGGMASGQYTFAVDSAVKHGGRASVRIEPTGALAEGYGGLYQVIDAQDYRTKRARVIAWVRGRDLSKSCNVWARAQGRESPADGLGVGGGNCRYEGTFGWRRCEIVFDVPATATRLEVGFGQFGAGTVWIDNIEMHVVGVDVPVTSPDRRPFHLLNGDFEDDWDANRVWFLSGPASKFIEAAPDSAAARRGERSLLLRSGPKHDGGYGSILQNVRADQHRGKRLELRAWCRGEGMLGLGEVWLRMQAQDSPADGPGLGRDACAVLPGPDWHLCSVVLDVPLRTHSVQVGVGMEGQGAIRVDDIELREVDRSMPVTALSSEHAGPENLDFER